VKTSDCVFDDRPCLQFRRYAGSDRQAVLSLNVAALESTNAFVEVADYYGDLRDIPATYLVGGGEFLVGEISGEVVRMGGLQLRTYEIAERPAIDFMYPRGVGGYNGYVMPTIARGPAACAGIRLGNGANCDDSSGGRERHHHTAGTPRSTRSRRRWEAKWQPHTDM
jgi:hypothetical protein